MATASFVPSFVPAAWLPGPHLQTLWGPTVRARRAVRFRREALETPDGDELILDHAEPVTPRDRAGRVLLLHGLEGSSSSVYVQGLASRLLARGLHVSALNFRSCARDPDDLARWVPNRRPRLYHSGETTDLDFVVETLAAREPATRLAAAAVSLGGNVLLKWLGEDPSHVGLTAAATISVPYDLGAGARHMESWSGRLYVLSFVRTLRVKVLSLAERFPEVRTRIDVPRMLRAQTFFELDDASTAPLHGFTGADDYYARSSSLQFLGGIRVPTLCLSAMDDPFLPGEVLTRAAAAASSSVALNVTPRGGHVGLVMGPYPWGARYWAEEAVVDWLDARV